MTYDVVIVGSGVAGLSSAYRLAPDHEVLVVDRDAIGNGTSSRASGVITTPVDYPDQPEWSRHALDFFRELDGTGVFEWTPREYVRGVRSGDVERAERRARADGVSLVDAAEYGETFDGSAPYQKALVWERTGYFDVDEFLATMHRECARRGVEFRPDTTVDSILVEDGAAVGVETEYGTVPADSVVVAAGSATRPLLADVLPLPIKKFTWNVAYLDAGIADDYPMGGDPLLGAYWRGTRDGHLLVGTEHPYGAAVDDEREMGDEITHLIEDDLPRLLAHVDAGTPVVRYECCPMADATTPDGRAIIDAPGRRPGESRMDSDVSPDEGPADLVVAAGFHGAGVMAADSIAAAVRAHLTGDDAPFPLDPFRLDRFETRDPDFAFRTMFQG